MSFAEVTACYVGVFIFVSMSQMAGNWILGDDPQRERSRVIRRGGMRSLSR